MDNISGLYQHINTAIQASIMEGFCFWSDLLGFGNIFFENGWKLSDAQKEEVSSRLHRAHSELLRYSLPLTEASLIINDGLVKTIPIHPWLHGDIIGLSLRNCIETHMAINRTENAHGYPGARSVLSFGESIRYFTPEVKVDDYVLNYTKKNPDDLSETAKISGNPTVVYNPVPFQMNMGFSKAYILDNLGSKSGVSGNSFFIDEDVLGFSRRFAAENNIKFIQETIEGQEGFYLKKRENYSHWGFTWSEEITISHKNWNTKVFRISAFYPPDCGMDEFRYEL